MTRYFYDCEFLEDGRTIALISIGIVTDDGREYYAVNDDAPWHEIAQHEWLMANVVPHLPVTLEPMSGLTPRAMKTLVPDISRPEVKSRQVIADEVRAFITGARVWNELWAYYGAYDHVALCQLFGPMIYLPDGIPMFTRDLQQEIARLDPPGLPDLVGDEHNALADARWNREVFKVLRSLGGIMSTGEAIFTTACAWFLVFTAGALAAAAAFMEIATNDRSLRWRLWGGVLLALTGAVTIEVLI